MLDGLLWKTVQTKTLWKQDGSLQWVMLEKHRLTGATRAVYPEFPEIRAQDYLGFNRGGETDA